MEKKKSNRFRGRLFLNNYYWGEGYLFHFGPIQQTNVDRAYPEFTVVVSPGPLGQGLGTCSSIHSFILLFFNDRTEFRFLVIGLHKGGLLRICPKIVLTKMIDIMGIIDVF